MFAICLLYNEDLEGAIVDDKRGSIKHGEVRDHRGHKRADQITQLLVGFDFEESRIVAAWGWLDVQMIDVPNGVRINARPALLLFRISYN
jgi:hypothetical protein